MAVRYDVMDTSFLPADPPPTMDYQKTDLASEYFNTFSQICDNYRDSDVNLRQTSDTLRLSSEILDGVRSEYVSTDFNSKAYKEPEFNSKVYKETEFNSRPYAREEYNSNPNSKPYAREEYNSNPNSKVYKKAEFNSKVYKDYSDLSDKVFLGKDEQIFQFGQPDASALLRHRARRRFNEEHGIQPPPATSQESGVRIYTSIH